MKLVMQKKELKDAISLLSSSVKKQLGAITSTILFKMEGQTLTLKASDNFVYTNLVLTTDGGIVSLEGEGEFTLEAERLSSWLSNVIEEEITFTVLEDEVMLSCGTFESPFPSKDPTTFPSKMFDQSYEKAELIAETDSIHLIEAISFVQGYVSTASSNTDHSGKLQIAQMREGVFLGTDAKLLGIFKSNKFNAEIKIGSDQIKAAISYLKKQAPEDLVRVLNSENFFFFEMSDQSYFGFTKPRNDLPNLEGIPMELVEEDIWELEKDHLKQAIGALKATADPDDPFLRMTVKEGAGDKGTIVLTMKAAKGNKDASVSLGCQILKTTAPEIEISASHVNIEKSISSYGDKVSVAYNEAEKYLKFYEETESGDLKICLMTLRV